MVPGPFALDIVTSLPKADVILASLVAYRSRRHQGLCKVLGVTKIHPSADSKLRETVRLLMSSTRDRSAEGKLL